MDAFKTAVTLYALIVECQESKRQGWVEALHKLLETYNLWLTTFGIPSEDVEASYNCFFGEHIP